MSDVGSGYAGYPSCEVVGSTRFFAFGVQFDDHCLCVLGGQLGGPWGCCFSIDVVVVHSFGSVFPGRYALM